MPDTLRIESLRGNEIAARRDVLAAIRIAVFREWPYLYEGSSDYETRYLDVYLRSPRSLAVLVWDGADCVGASTVLPLADATADVQQPFRNAGHDVAAIAYFAESVILKPYRGRGLGVRFFQEREAHARATGLSICAFCAVQRPEDHPLKPRDYTGNAAFWHKRGYQTAPDLSIHFSWPDLGAAESTSKPMACWMRDLSAVP